MMRAWCLTLFAGLICTAAAEGQVRDFPYEATVQADDVYVRSGPGQRYYPTGKVNRNDRVTVHRHDPGGWYMIAPPPGSFSWIDASLVEQTGEGVGVVKVPSLGSGQQARAIVRIGSEFGDDHDVYSRELSNGETVTILGEQELQTDRGRVLMYKIAPPVAEYRWVKGDYIVPLSEAVRQQQDSDPFAVPSPHRRRASAPEPDASSGPDLAAAPDHGGGRDGVLREEVARGEQTGAVRRTGPGADVSEEHLQRLQEIDDWYAAMIADDPSTWRLDQVEQEYRALLAESGGTLADEVSTRLAALETRKRILADYQDFVRLTTQTEQRDARLAAMQGAPPGPAPASSGVRLGPPEPIENDAAAADPSHRSQLAPIPDQPLPRGVRQPVTPNLSGAGLIYRVQRPLPGWPQHVLVHPDGRVLAYLQPASGIDLDQYLGREMGLIGERTYDPRLRADRLIVRRLMPVRLRP